MSESSAGGWDQEFRPVEGREGIDFASRDGRTVVDVQLSPQGMRGVYAGLMSLGLFLSRAPSVSRGYLLLDASRLSKERLLRQWHSLKNVLKPEITDRLSLVAIKGGESIAEPDDDYSHWLADAFRKSQYATALDRSPTLGLRQFVRQRYFEVVKVLLIRWLLRQGPIPLGQLARLVGCTYPTVREALHQLVNKDYIKRYTNRTVELARFPHGTWGELVALSSRIRRPVRFVDKSGQKPDPQFLLKQLERLRLPAIGIGGVVAAAHWHPDFDLHGLPRLDLVVHAPDGAVNLAFVKRLDPALKEADSSSDSSVLVVHPLLRAQSIFLTSPETPLPLADPVETTLDLVEMGLPVQAGQLLQHLRKESRVS
jgi:hypothetical protein